jgi:hypothetical protein
MHVKCSSRLTFSPVGVGRETRTLQRIDPLQVLVRAPAHRTGHVTCRLETQ